MQRPAVFAFCVLLTSLCEGLAIVHTKAAGFDATSLVYATLAVVFFGCSMAYGVGKRW